MSKLAKTEKATWGEWVEPQAESFAAVATAHLQPDRLARVFLSEMKRTPKLKKCDPDTLVTSLILCSQLGLEPSSPLGHIYLIPYGTTCTPIIGYKGMQELIRRTGEVRTMVARCFTQGELDSGLLELSIYPANVKHAWSNVDVTWENLAGAYCAVEMNDGTLYVETCTKAEIESRKKRSGAGNSGPWKTDPVAMAEKCAVRKLFGRGRVPISAEHQSLLAVAMEQDADSGTRRVVVSKASRDMAALTESIEASAEVVDQPDLPETAPEPRESTPPPKPKKPNPASKSASKRAPKPEPVEVADLQALEKLMAKFRVPWPTVEKAAEAIGLVPEAFDQMDAKTLTEIWAQVCEVRK